MYTRSFRNIPGLALLSFFTFGSVTFARHLGGGMAAVAQLPRPRLLAKDRARRWGSFSFFFFCFLQFFLCVSYFFPSLPPYCLHLSLSSSFCSVGLILHFFISFFYLSFLSLYFLSLFIFFFLYFNFRLFFFLNFLNLPFPSSLFGFFFLHFLFCVFVSFLLNIFFSFLCVSLSLSLRFYYLSHFFL